MKVIFLDIDGVLTTERTKYRVGDVDCVAQLNRITEATGADIVISSSWRHDPEIANVLAAWGVRGKVVGITPNLSVWMKGIRVARERGDEIYRWLCDNMPAANYVILDDESDMGPVINRWLRTSTQFGLQQGQADAAIRLLGDKP